LEESRAVTNFAIQFVSQEKLYNLPKMETHGMFNAVLKDFMSELRAAYPGNEGIHNAKKKIKNVSKISPKLPCSLFKESMKPFAELITNKDEAFVYGDAGKIMKKTLGIDVEEIWGDAQQETKDCIWNYINTLYMLSSKEVQMNEDAMNKIQELASQLSAQVGPDLLESPQNMKDALSQMASNIDTDAIHDIIKQIDPGLADQMLPGLESGELMKGVSSMIANLDPALLENVSKMMSDPENMDMSKLMGNVMGNVDIMKMMRTMSGDGDFPKLLN
jgi:hypothetical protein